MGVDEDGCVRVQTAELSRLEQRLKENLAEVQFLFQDKYGHGSNNGSYEDSVQSSTDLLIEVKALYAQKYSHLADDLDEDGFMWSQTDACGNVGGNTELQRLQVALDTVK